MGDLEKARDKLRAELIEREPAVQSFKRIELWDEGFDAGVAFMREVVAEKDREISNLNTVIRERTRDLDEIAMPEITRLTAENNKIKAKFYDLSNLHSKYDGDGEFDPSCDGCEQSWPCSTRKILDGFKHE